MDGYYYVGYQDASYDEMMKELQEHWKIMTTCYGKKAKQALGRVDICGISLD